MHGVIPLGTPKLLSRLTKGLRGTQGRGVMDLEWRNHLDARITWPECARLCKSSEPTDTTALSFEWGQSDHVLRRVLGTSALPHLREIATFNTGWNEYPLQLYRELAARGRPLDRLVIYTAADLGRKRYLRLTLSGAAEEPRVDITLLTPACTEEDAKWAAKGFGVLQMISSVQRAALDED